MIPAPEHIQQLKRFGQQNGIFIFKHFRMKDDRSTMRIGTDAVLLGIAVEVPSAGTILEVGTGSGIIALILAQRSPQSYIDAVEIDPESARQAAENASASPWAGRIFVMNTALQDYIMTCAQKYDLVVSNPPFFSRSFKSECARRNRSRHDDELSFDELIAASERVLTPEGSLWVILPIKESREFRQKAAASGFFLKHELLIIPKPGKEANRTILCFVRRPPEQTTTGQLTLRDGENRFHPDYMAFARDFYIDF